MKFSALFGDLDSAPGTLHWERVQAAGSLLCFGNFEVQRMYQKEQGGWLEVTDAVKYQLVVLSVWAVMVGRGQHCLNVSR